MTETAANRREALRRGALAAGALAAGGLLRPALALAAQSPDDEDLRDFLVEAIGLEQVTVLAYADAADADPKSKQLYERFRDQEQAHANALRQAIDELGFDAPDAPNDATDTGVFDGIDGLDDEAAAKLKDQLGEVGKAKTPTDYLNVINRLESAQLEYYVANGPALDSADLSTTATEIAGCQGQHQVVLSGPGKPRGIAATVGAIGLSARQAAAEATSTASAGSTTSTTSTTSTSTDTTSP